MQQEVYMTIFFATVPLVGILFEVLRIVRVIVTNMQEAKTDILVTFTVQSVIKMWKYVRSVDS